LGQAKPNAIRSIVDDLGWDDKLYRLIIGKALPTIAPLDGTVNLLHARLKRARDLSAKG
jgi:hypothetical protein